MIKAELANEFTTVDRETGSPTLDHKAREVAFRDFNKLVRENPGHVARVMGAKAMEAKLDEYDKGIAEAAEGVLSVTNNGTQIGFDRINREDMWEQIFNDPWHYNANRDYHKERAKNGADSEAAQQLSRRRGFYALCVFAEQQIKDVPKTAEAA